MLNDLAQRLSSEFSQALPQIEKLIPKRQLDIFLQDKLAKLNLVTREEFDAQQAVLLRTRAKLEELERKMSELEQRTPQD